MPRPCSARSRPIAAAGSSSSGVGGRSSRSAASARVTFPRMAAARVSAGSRRKSGISDRMSSPIRATTASSSASISATRATRTRPGMAATLRRGALQRRRGEQGGGGDQREGGKLDGEHDAAGERVPEHRDPPPDDGDVGGGGRAADDRDGVALLEAAGGGEEGQHGGQGGDRQPRREQQFGRAARGGERLHRDVGEPEQRAGREAEDRAMMVRGGTEARGGD